VWRPSLLLPDLLLIGLVSLLATSSVKQLVQVAAHTSAWVQMEGEVWFLRNKNWVFRISWGFV
jgi:hypothetical protein